MTIVNAIIDARMAAKDVSEVDKKEEMKYLYLTLRLIELRKVRSKRSFDSSYERVEGEHQMLEIVMNQIKASSDPYYEKVRGLSNDVILNWYGELLGEYSKILRKELKGNR